MNQNFENPLLRQRAFIAGEWCDSSSGRRFAVTNPATLETLAHVPALTAEETQRAIAAAEKALPEWRSMTAHARSKILRCWYDLMIENLEDLARLMTAEQGKPIQESRSEILYAAGFIEWFSEEAKRVYGDTIPANQAGKRVVVIKQPVGVCAAITPWNFPAAMITRKAGPALAAGCTMVIKPASQTPLTALALAELGQRAGIPAGVLSVVTGPAGEVGNQLATHPTVRKLSFTGSTEVGRKLLAMCAGTIKKVSMELGGNAPFIIFDDADLDAAVEGVIASKFRNTGQTCVCANRIFVQAGVYEDFSARLCAAIGKLRVGNGLTETVEQGPLIDMQAVEKVEEHISDALEKGARALVGGKRHARGGTYFEPTVLVDVPLNALVCKEETFGPVAPLIRFECESDVIEMANDTEFGLAAYFYSKDLARTWRVAESLETGMVGINTGAISAENVPFGGIKESGIGREGGNVGIDEYVELKYLCVAGL